MQIAVLPLNAGPDTRPALARQISNFACEIARNVTGQEIHAVNYLAQYQDEGVQRVAMVNPSEALNEPEMIGQFWQQAPMETLIDGLLNERDGAGSMILRVYQRPETEPQETQEFDFIGGALFAPVRGFVETLLRCYGASLPEQMGDDIGLFGTENAEAFAEFLLGFDAVQYIEKANGMVAREFNPQGAYESLEKAMALDPDWEAPYLALLNLARLCTQFRIGAGDAAEAALKKVTETEPDDPRGFYALAEFYGAVNNLQASADTLEKTLVKLQQHAAKLRKEAEGAKAVGDVEASQSLLQEADQTDRDQSPVLARLGIAQMNMGMPANAERNLRKAVENEGEDKPSLALLSQVLTQTGRAHEVPPMWKELIDKSPQNAVAHVNYAQALMASGNQDGATRALDVALETLEDTSFVKRFYAPLLAQKEEFDRAMDYYEDYLDENPTDVQVMLEYAQTLQNAKREFEVPQVLKNVLSANIDPNTRAQTQAWLIELEQKNRVEAVRAASEKVESGDFQGAVNEIKPLRNWLADYWKMWAILAAAYNRLGEYTEAEQAAHQLLNIFPGCEPAYNELANALGGQGRNEEAYNVLRAGMQNVQNSLPIAVNFGLAAKRTGRGDEAKAMARQLREATRGQEQPGLGELLDEMESDL
ncbi:MAG: hypothetical protein KIT11_04335 [Fimbriimonadaceae bacterium]|nr:hypothetical protein [Fimbriimonadaceae bacterium]QYK56876.1 MAG: hypothetical protein KF733_05190 [Fimbriimonadaceae bacterium]